MPVAEEVRFLDLPIALTYMDLETLSKQTKAALRLCSQQIKRMIDETIRVACISRRYDLDGTAIGEKEDCRRKRTAAETKRESLRTHSKGPETP
jgi:hypothetical protein